MCEAGQQSMREPVPRRKLAEVLAELSPLPGSETLADLDDVAPLDSDPLV